MDSSRINSLLLLSCLLSLAACNHDEGAGDSSISLSGSFYHDDMASGERSPVTGRADLIVLDESETPIHIESATTVADGTLNVLGISA